MTAAEKAFLNAFKKIQIFLIFGCFRSQECLAPRTQARARCDIVSSGDKFVSKHRQVTERGDRKKVNSGFYWTENGRRNKNICSIAMMRRQLNQ